MDAQEALFATDFKWAVIRLVTLQYRRGEPGRLLFASVSLLTPGRPEPLGMAGFELHNIKGDTANVCFRRVVMSAKDAINWYCIVDEEKKAPIPSRKEDVEKFDGIDIVTHGFANDPEWPNIGLPVMGAGLLSISSEHNDPAPFTGSASARIHRRFGNKDGFEVFLSNREALLFAERRVHIDFSRYNEYLGSVVLIVPDPIIKQVDNFLVPAGGDRGERVFYRFVPNPGQSLEGLKITFFDEHASLLTNFETLDIPTHGILDIEKGSCFGQYGYVVTHPVHRVLVYHPPAGFLRRISFNMGLVNQVRQINVPMGESPKSPVKNYTVNRTVLSQGGTVGDEIDHPNIAGRVAESTRQRERKIIASQFGQRWFDPGMRSQAMDFIHSLLGNAKTRILVADPYFGVLQVPQFLLAVRSDEVEMTILTSRLAFESDFLKEEGEVSPSLIDRLNEFHQQIVQVRDAGNSEIQVKVLPGKKPVLHDRFLVVDDAVWFLGNSLNTLGDRSAMIIRLPDPVEVLAKLESMLPFSNEFDAYRDERLKLAEEGRE